MAAQAQNICWFAARTRHGQEIGVRNRLSSLGVEHFIPTETGRSTRGNRKIERPLINSMVFLRTTKNEACALANERALPVKYMFDCATRSMLVVPDKQMEDFRRVLDFSIENGGLEEVPLCLGDKVRVTKGVLAGVEGYVVEFQGKTYVVVSLCDCVFAKALVPRAWLEKI